jgi:hypothetical protein
MQEPTNQAKAPIPTETVSNDPNLNRTVAARRKFSKRTVPWDLKVEELDLVSPPPRAEDIPARKKRRLEEPFSASADEAARKNASPDVSVGLLPPTADSDDTNVLDPNLLRANGRTGKWTKDEDSKLKDALQTHGGKDWVAMAALVPGRTRNQCYQRWHDVLQPKIGRASGRKGKWTNDEDCKLKDAVQTQVDKNWGAISFLVPGRTKAQCSTRWHDTLKPSIDRASGRKGKFSAAEDIQLKDAVQTHGDKDWVAISLLVPGRTKKQCWNRWKYLDPNRRAVREKDLGTLKTAPALGQDRHSS